jgi:hypothetical protein
MGKRGKERKRDNAKEQRNSEIREREKERNAGEQGKWGKEK